MSPRSPRNSRLAMLQSMLFFGLWEFITGNQISSRDYIQSSDENRSLCCTALRGCIQGIGNLLGSKNVLPSNLISVKVVVERLARVTRDILAWDSILVAQHHDQFSEAISTLRRQTALTVDILDLFNNLPAMSESRITGFHHLGRNGHFHVERLKTHGIFPSYYAYLDFVNTSAVEYFAVACPFINPSGTSHRLCNEHKCIANNAETMLGTANHLKNGCDCCSINLSMSGIKETLDSNQYFVVDIERLLDSKLSASDAITPFYPGLAYVAFSHVWSHGLGNVADKGLPRCRLRQLRRLISSLSSRFGAIKHFWIDAMCIPKDEDLKMKSIGLMDQIYQNSTVVMVLDKTLQQISVESLTYECLALCILISDWNRRLWTFQEARLGTNVAVSLKSRWISIHMLCEALLENGRGGTATPVTFDCAHQLSCLTQNTTGLFQWMGLLQFRKCSVAADEALVISTLMGLNTESLLAETDRDLRMANLWAIIGQVPSGLLFHASPKLEVDGKRWAPRTLLCGSSETGVGGARCSDSEVTSQGLSAPYFVCDFEQTLRIPTDQDSRGYIVVYTQELILRCYRRCDEEKFEGREDSVKAFDAIAFARDPRVHKDCLPNTALSAAALLRVTDSGSEDGLTTDRAQYVHQFQILADIGAEATTEFSSGVTVWKRILIS